MTYSQSYVGQTDSSLDSNVVADTTEDTVVAAVNPSEDADAFSSTRKPLNGFYYNLKPSKDGKWDKDHWATDLVEFPSFDDDQWHFTKWLDGATHKNFHRTYWPDSFDGSYQSTSNSINWADPKKSLRASTVDANVRDTHYSTGVNGFRGVFNRNSEDDAFHTTISDDVQHYTTFNWSQPFAHTQFDGHGDDAINSIFVGDAEKATFVPQVLGFSMSYSDTGSWNKSNHQSAMPSHVQMHYMQRNSKGGNQDLSSYKNQVLSIRPQKQIGNIAYNEQPSYGKEKTLAYIFNKSQWAKLSAHFNPEVDDGRYLWVGFSIETHHPSHKGTTGWDNRANYWNFRLIVGDNPDSLVETWAEIPKSERKILIAGNPYQAKKSQFCQYGRYSYTGSTSSRPIEAY